jgi:hypothetical protein
MRLAILLPLPTENISQLQTKSGHESLLVDRWQKIERRVCSPDSLVGDVSVERSGLQASVPEQHLDSANVGACFKQMSREAVSKRPQRDWLG